MKFYDIAGGERTSKLGSKGRNQTQRKWATNLTTKNGNFFVCHWNALANKKLRKDTCNRSRINI